MIRASSSRTALRPTPCVTLSLVPEATRGPFVFHGALSGSLRRAAACGYRHVEIFARSAAELDERSLRRGLAQHHLTLAALGTGAGFLVERLHLLDADATRRAAAVRFITAFIDRAGSFGAPAIIGSMKGSLAPGMRQDAAENRLAETLAKLARRAEQHGTILLLEPLNRYETNCINTLAEGAALLAKAGAPNLRLLADCFHMSIEETSIPTAIRQAKSLIGHIHFVDSNRRAAGLGHLDFSAIAKALRDIRYSGYLSAEVLPLPSPTVAAKQTLAAFHTYITPGVHS